MYATTRPWTFARGRNHRCVDHSEETEHIVNVAGCIGFGMSIVGYIIIIFTDRYVCFILFFGYCVNIVNNLLMIYISLSGSLFYYRVGPKTDHVLKCMTPVYDDVERRLIIQNV